MKRKSSGRGPRNHTPLSQTFQDKPYAPTSQRSISEQLPPEYYQVSWFAYALDQRSQEALHYDLCLWLNDISNGGHHHA